MAIISRLAFNCQTERKCQNPTSDPPNPRARYRAASVGACDAPADAHFQSLRFPIVIKPGRRATFRMRVDIDCANDPERTTTKRPDHDDYRLRVTVTPGALDTFTRSALTPPAAPPIEVDALLDVVQK